MKKLLLEGKQYNVRVNRVDRYRSHDIYRVFDTNKGINYVFNVKTNKGEKVPCNCIMHTIQGREALEVAPHLLNEVIGAL